MLNLRSQWLRGLCFQISGRTSRRQSLFRAAGYRRRSIETSPTVQTFEVRILPAGATLVQDVNSSTASSSPSNLTQVGSKLFFTATTAALGTELYISDGTAAGTQLVKDISPGAGSSAPRHLVDVNGMLFFAAVDADGGEELWKSDGTPEGTARVVDISPGVVGSFPQNLTNVDGTLYFYARSTFSAAELWKSNGTASGTTLVKDIRPGIPGSDLRDLTKVGEQLFFTVASVARNEELWVSDGTQSGTRLVMEISPTGSDLRSTPFNMVSANGILYYKASNGASGYELWRSDGTTGGTFQVSDIAPGAASSHVTSLTNVDGTIYFSATSSANNFELWKTNGSLAGTALVKEINSTTVGSYPIQMLNHKGVLYFSADDGIHGRELWVSDGTQAGTTILKDMNVGSASSHPFGMTSIGDHFYFEAVTALNGSELWQSDGTATGTSLISDFAVGVSSFSPGEFRQVGTRVFFAATTPSLGRELWSIDTAVGPFGIVLSNATVAENSAAGVVVGTLTATPTPGSSFTYQFVSGTPESSGNSSFTINGNQLRTAASFNFESVASYTVRIRATDQNGNFVEQALVIAVTDVNDAPLSLILRNSITTLPENTPTPLTVATIFVNDDPLGQNLLYLSGQDAASFEIVGDTLRLRSSVVLDFETKKTYVVRVNVDDPSIGSNPDRIANLILTITDVDESPILVSLQDQLVAEGATAFVPVQLSRAASSSVTVNYEVVAGSASSGLEFVAAFGTLQLSAGSTGGVIAVPTFDDDLYEDTETIFVRILSVTGAGIADGEATVFVDSYDPAPQISISGPVSLVEGEAAVFAIRLNHPSGLATSVRYTVTSRMPGRGDIVRISEIATFAPGETLISITLPGIQDAIDEPVEQLLYSLSQGNGGSIAAESAVAKIVSVMDDDPAPTVTFLTSAVTVTEATPYVIVWATLSHPSAYEVTVPVEIGGTASLGQDFTTAPNPARIVFGAGAVQSGMVVTLLNDSISETTELLTAKLLTPTNATLANAAITVQTITIADDDAPKVSFETPTMWVREEGGVATVKVKLSNPHSENVTIPFNAFPLGLSAAEYELLTAGPLLIPAGQTEAAISVRMIDDTLFEGLAIEQLRFVLGTPTNASLGAIPNMDMIVRDNDVPMVSFQQAEVNVTEGNQTSFSVSVFLDREADRDFEIPIVMTGTAVLGKDYSISGPRVLMIPIYRGFQYGVSGSITLLDDFAPEANKSLRFDLGSSESFRAGAIASQTLTIRDNDSTPIVSFSQASQSLTEGKGTQTVAVTVTLSNPWYKDVAFDLAAGGNAIDVALPKAGQANDYRLLRSLKNLVIPAGETSRTFTLAELINDANSESEDSLTFTIKNVRDGIGGNPGVHNVKILDKDAAPSVAFVNGATTVNEGVKTVKITVDVNTTPGQDIVIPVKLSGTAKRGSDYTFLDQLVIAAGTPGGTKVFEVKIIDDTEREEDESIVIELLTPLANSATVGAIKRHVITIAANDKPVSPPPKSTVTTGTGSGGGGGGTGQTTKPPQKEVIAAGNLAFGSGVSVIDWDSVEKDGVYIQPDSTKQVDQGESGFSGTVAIFFGGANKYISGATVFLDSNRNGIADFIDLNGDGEQSEDEPFELSTTSNVAGFAGLEFSAEYDLNQNGLFDAADGAIVYQGGTDLTTGLPVKTTLTAPGGFSTVSPLTTLVAEFVYGYGMSVESAQHRVLESFSLPALDLATVHHVSETLLGGTSSRLLLVANAQLNDTVVQLASLLVGGAGGVEMDFIASAVYAELASRNQVDGSLIDLADAVAVQSLLEGVAARVGVDISTVDLAAVSGVIAGGNLYLAAVSETDGTAFIAAIARSQKVAQGVIANALTQQLDGEAPGTDWSAFVEEARAALVAGTSIDDVVPSILYVSSTARFELAGESYLEFHVTLLNPSVHAVSAEYTTSDGTAEAGSDYESTTGVLTWAPGDVTERIIRVKITGDSTFEPDEMMHVFLSNPQHAVLGGDVGYGIIINDDVLTYTAPASAGPNEIRLRLSDGQIEIELNGEVVVQEEFIFSTRIVLNGGQNAANRFIIDAGDGLPMGLGGLLIVGGSGANDAIVLQNLYNTQISTTGAPGVLTIGGIPIEFQNVEDVPSARFQPIAPMQSATVGNVTLTFSHDVAALASDDLLLTRNGVAIDLTGVTLVQESPRQFRIDLSSVTGTSGAYVLSLKTEQSDLLDQNGNTLSFQADLQWTTTISPVITGFEVQNGAVQRSFVNQVQVSFASSAGLDSLISSGRIRLTRYDLDGQNGVIVSHGAVTRNGQTLTFDWGAQGVGGNRSSTAGDGYYVLEFDLDQNNTFESARRFYRLLGDVNGDRVVNATDSAIIQGRIGQPYVSIFDLDGNGVVDARDRLVVQRSLNRRLLNTLLLDR